MMLELSHVCIWSKKRKACFTVGISIYIRFFFDKIEPRDFNPT